MGAPQQPHAHSRGGREPHVLMWKRLTSSLSVASILHSSNQLSGSEGDKILVRSDYPAQSGLEHAGARAIRVEGI